MKFASKKELLVAIADHHALLVERVDSLPRRELTRPGVWGDDWTIKDLLAHLYEWERMLLGWYRAGKVGDEPELPAPGYKWNETPRLNAEIWRRHRRKSYLRVRAEFDASFDEIWRWVDGLSERDLLTPGSCSWTGKLPLMTYVAANTSSHYATALKILDRWERARKA